MSSLFEIFIGCSHLLKMKIYVYFMISYSILQLNSFNVSNESIN